MKSPQETAATTHAGMRERTGHDLAEWVAIVEAQGLDPLDQLAVRRWLRDEHAVPQNTQWAIAFEVARRAGWTMPTPEEFADQMYPGSKAVLRPLHDAVVALFAAAGPDVTIEGRASYTPASRARQFAAVGPGPRGTVRVGLRFREAPDDERLSPAKGFAQATHWLHLDASDDPATIGENLGALVALAYAQNG